MKRPLIKLIIISLFLTSCDFTEKLWRKTYYHETIKNFLISKDGRKIVFLGEKYHYVFDDKDAEIRDLLLWEGRDILEISRFNFEITSLDKVRGKILVSTLKDHIQASEDYIKFLKTSGFKSIKRNDSGYQKELYLTGIRYLPKPNTSYDVNSSLNQEYKVTIANNDLYDRSKKIALTPITVVGDTAIFALGVTAVILFVPALVVCSSVSENCLKIK
jgi:hypothetical protein